MTNVEMHNLIVEFKEDAKNIVKLSNIRLRVTAIVLDAFYFWFASRKETNRGDNA